MTRRIAAAFAGLFALAGCTGIEGAALSSAPGIRVDSSFLVSTQTWTSGTRFTHYFRGLDRDGELVVCGATVVKDGATTFKSMMVDEVMRRSRLKLRGETLLIGLDRRFAIIRDNDEGRPAQAKCTATGLPYPENATNLLSVRGPRSLQVGS